MRIDRVYLKNFRTHRELELNFAPGMNLLLGQNGSGKSSVLEAIGITLFDSKFRDGNSTGKDQVIKFGEKEALVEIEFQGNDEKTYIVQNSIKPRSGYYRIFEKENPEEIISGGDEVREKLKVLLGIGGNLGNTYDNIIVAKQNEFINIYKLRGAERKKVFDEIFETDIYEKIYRGFSKDAGDRYRSELEKSLAKLETLKGKAENPGEILKELEESEKSKTLVDKNLKHEEEMKKSLERNIEENLALEKNIERAEMDIAGEIKILETQGERLAQNKKDREEAERSLNIVTENKESYKKYLELQEEGGRLKEKIIALEDGINTMRKKESEMKNLEKKSLEIEGESEREKIYLATNRENFEKLRELKIEKEEELFLARKRGEALELEEKNLLPLIVRGENFEKEMRNLDYLLEIGEGKLSQDKKDYEEVIQKLEFYKGEKLEEKIEALQKKQGEKIFLEGEINKITALLENSREAEKKLSTALCPYLDEKCKNLEGSSDPGEFFREREERFLQEMKEKRDLLAGIGDELKSFDYLNKMKREEEISDENRKKLEIALEMRKKEIKIYQLQRENIGLQREKFREEGGDLEKLRERKISLLEERKHLHIENIEERVREISQEILELDKNFRILYERKALLEKIKSEIVEKIETLKIGIKELVTLEEKLAVEKNKLGSLEEKLRLLKAPYDLYNRSLESALRLEEHREKGEILERSIQKITFGIEKLKENLQKFQEELDKKISLNSLREEKEVLEEKILGLHRESGVLLAKIDELKARAKKSQNDLLEIEGLQNTGKILGKKLELTGKFRDNIKGMGEKVAESIIRRIAFFATENFRKITGRGESIIWSGKDSAGKDSPYSVLLEGADRDGNIRKVNFDQLSGGEQVAVAISIRGAMNSIFTKTGFSIFDEPTNNLDQERRKILADNIGEILQNMEQSIIVTHDDTFKEMAQQVIEL